MKMIENLTLCRKKLIWSREGEHDFVDSADGAGGHKLGSTCSRRKSTRVLPCGTDDNMKQEHCCVVLSDGKEQMGRRKLSRLYSSARGLGTACMRIVQHTFRDQICDYHFNQPALQCFKSESESLG